MAESDTQALAQSLLGENGGHIYRKHFSGLEDLDHQLVAWVGAAPADLSDDATRTYAYWRAFDWRAEHAAHEPAMHSVNAVGSEQTTQDQREKWRRKRDYWWAEYERRKKDDGTDAGRAARSQSVPSQVSWV
jgi:hypothetical protein